MSHTRHASKRPLAKRGTKIHPDTKELCLQYRSMGLTLNEICDKTLLSYGSVEYILTKWADRQPEVVKRARAKAMEELALRVNEKAVMALSQITPDSLTHDRIEHYDDKGKLVGVSHSGPTGQQIAVAAGILIDKAKTLEDKAAALRGETPLTLGPDSFAALLATINGRVTRLTQVNANVDLSGITARIAEFGDLVPEEDKYVTTEFQDVSDAEYEDDSPPESSEEL